ncbi:hypothetical protein DRE_02862 [Drechslerella stenobrocha 248]|uniref:Transmembrane protein UsgS n=1 Tax=Drechslerella stenobrocha 248 TaxID=1043628 RepID=W7IFS6_9PEZI|nr:hypothetical protein DRE_02862 [Drechslerella stenobrocha 248]
MTPEVFKQKAIDSLQSFDPGLVLRGAQLTVVGAYRAMQNPALFRSRHYKQAALAVLAGLLVKLILDLPIIAVSLLVSFSGLFVDIKTAHWDDWIISGVRFIEKNVLQLPFFLMTLTTRLQNNALDEMFMESLSWVDETNLRKHANDVPPRNGYYQSLAQWKPGVAAAHAAPANKDKRSNKSVDFIRRMAYKGAVSLAVYLSSTAPIVGRLVLPAASAFSIHPTIGIGPAIAVFVAGLWVPRPQMVIVLQAYHASRSLVRQLLEPYFSRIHFTAAQKKRWFRERQGLLLGFGIGFYLFLRVPFLGVLIYGIAEASTAYLITKITDPPPPPSEGAGFADTQAEWRGKQEFVTVPLVELDRRVGQILHEGDGKSGPGATRRKGF